MTHINVKNGLDIPVLGEATGAIRQGPVAEVIGYNFQHHEAVKFRVLVKPGDHVKVGDPLAEDKDVPGRFFVSCAGGIVDEVKRGEKRRLLAITVKREREEQEKHFSVDPLGALTQEQIIHKLLEAGLFAYIKMRPFDRLAHPKKMPRSIFVKAIESAPFVPMAEMQVVGHEKEFQVGLSVLAKLTSGKVHLVHKAGIHFAPFTDATGVEKHTVAGPHPAGNVSLHIHKIDPIQHVGDVVWTVSVLDVIAIGTLFSKGKIAKDSVIAIAGPSVLVHERGLYRVRKGQAVNELIENKLAPGMHRIISGDPLTGDECMAKDSVGMSDTVLCAFPEEEKREFLHFFRFGADKYTASGAYASGHMDTRKKRWNFTTSQHGEERAFIDGSVYESVMPLQILPMQLVRAIMGDDWELAEELGVLEVHHEDFALCEFVCPSKIEMMEIVKNGLQQYCKDIFG